MMGKPMHLSSDCCTLSSSSAANMNLVDSLSIMMEQESTTYLCADYLNNDSNSSGTHHQQEDNATTPTTCYRVSPDDRMQIVDWCYQIVDQCQFDRETVAMAINLADRFMCTPQAQGMLHHRGQYQLVAVAALYMSIKTNERMSFGAKDFASLSNGTYSEEDIVAMEWTMLQALAWRINPPTSLQVAHHVLRLMLSSIEDRETPSRQLQQGTATWAFVQEEVSFQIENSVRDYYFTTRRASTVAVAAILNAIEQVNDRDYTILIVALTSMLHDFDFDSPHLVKEVMDRLNSVVNQTSNDDDDDEGTVIVPQEAEADPRPSSEPYETMSCQSTHPVSIQENGYYPEEQDLVSELSLSDHKDWHRESYTDVCYDIYHDIGIAADVRR